MAGLDNSTGVWRTSPEPLINQSNLQFSIKYQTDQGFPIGFARITATLHWASYSKTLYTEEVGLLGYYNVTIDTTPIQDITFHTGDEPFIQIRASKQGFEETVFSPIYLRPQPRPSFIDMPSEHQHIQLYANWTYAVPFRVVLRDSITNEDLSHGNVTSEIPGIGIVELEREIPEFGIYELVSLDTSLMTPQRGDLSAGEGRRRGDRLRAGALADADHALGRVLGAGSLRRRRRRPEA